MTQYRPNTLEEIEELGGYKIIYADPNWSYRNGGRGAANGHYETTTIEEIARLPVRRLAAPDAVLFLWVTWPILRDAFAVIDGWGFSYKTCAFVWVKYHEESGKRCVGGGFWTRANTEFCLLCVRGDDYPRRLDKSIRQLIETGPEDLLLAPRRKHSAKPDEARNRIFELLGNHWPAIELFARCVDDDGNVIPGGRVAMNWDQWGNECESDIQMSMDVAIENKSETETETETEISTETERAIENERATETEGDNRADTNDISDDDGDEAMAQLPKALADKVGDARTAGGGNYIQHGDYVMMIKSWFYQNIQDECIILEVIPVEARKKVIYEGQKKIEQDPNPPGSECTSVANFSSEAKQSAPANSRAPALGLFGFKEGDVPNAKVSDTMQYVTSDAQPAKGMLIGCSTFPKEIRSRKGNYIVGLNWSCVTRPGIGVNSAEAVQARLDAWARGPEELIKVAMEQLNQARAAGAAPTLADVSEASPSATPALASSPVMGSAAATPGTPPPPPSPTIDRLAGWTANPNDSNWYYRFIDGKPEQKLKSDLLAGR